MAERRGPQSGAVLRLIGVGADLVVEGDDAEVGRFRGRVLAIAVEDGPEREAGPPSAAATWLLVADDQQPGPVWVAQGAVSAQRLGR